MDSELESSRAGMRALLLSFLALMVTALVQLAVVAVTGSVALLGDTMHNFADALTALPLAIAFTLGRRAATRRYTYGYGRAEDLAGIVVVLFIAASAVVRRVEAVRRLADPRDVDHLVARRGRRAGRVRRQRGGRPVPDHRGRRIGSAALVADGLHARTDGFTSLAVVLGAAGVALGFEQADPLIGLLITVAILAVLRDAAREVYRRLMDAVDPELVDTVEATARRTAGRARRRRRTAALDRPPAARRDRDRRRPDTSRSSRRTRSPRPTEHQLLHDVARLHAALVHADPAGHPHDLTGHHRPDRAGAPD